MTLVRILEDGPNCDGVAILRGAVVDISPEAAAQKVDVGSAVYVDEPEVETAEAPAPPENTAKRTRKAQPREGSRKGTFSPPKA